MRSRFFRMYSDDDIDEIAYGDPIDDEFVYTGEIITDPEVAAKRAGYPVLVGYFYVSN